MTGVTTTEIMVAHLVNQFTVLCGQTALVFLFMLLVFAIPCHGSLASAVFITLLQGLCGMSYGECWIRHENETARFGLDVRM